jgi:Domain of unknown function (DUF4124)
LLAIAKLLFKLGTLLSNLQPTTETKKMKIIRIPCLTILMCSALLAQAQAYKCKQANGSLSFQDQPCQGGAVGAAVALPPLPGGSAGADSQPMAAQKAAIQKTPGSGESRQDKERESQNRRAQEELRLRAEEMKAFNQRQHCNEARQQLGLLKEPRALYRRDNKGDREYIQDESRPSMIAAAERRIAENCK